MNGVDIHLIQDQDVRDNVAICTCGAKMEAPSRNRRFALIYQHLSDVCNFRAEKEESDDSGRDAE